MNSDQIIRHHHTGINDIGAEPYCDMRDKVFAIEAEMKKQPQLELEVKNHFCNGVYARELFIPKNVIIVGKIHKYQNLNMLVKGRLMVSIDDNITEVNAPFVVVSPAGTKRIVYAIEDSIWITIHRTDELDLNKIEEHFIAQNEQEWLDFCKNEPKLQLEDDLLTIKCGLNGSFKNPNWPEIEMK